jgi:hypothetical protein
MVDGWDKDENKDVPKKGQVYRIKWEKWKA